MLLQYSIFKKGEEIIYHVYKKSYFFCRKCFISCFFYSRYPKAEVTIYTGDIEYSPSEILLRVRQRFNIILSTGVEFVYLTRRKWIEASKYPYFTLLGQSIGSIWLGMEALSAYQPGNQNFQPCYFSALKQSEQFFSF